MRVNNGSQAAISYQGSLGTNASFDIYAPQLAQFTQFTSLYAACHASYGVIAGFSNGTHATSTAYDGISIISPSGTITGTVRIYGYANS